MNSDDKNKGKVLDITQLISENSEKKNSAGFTISVNDDDIISFLKVAALLRSFSISEMVQINLNETELLVKVSNYLDLEEDNKIESGTNLQLASSMPFYPPETEKQISDTVSVESFRKLLDKLEITD